MKTLNEAILSIQTDLDIFTKKTGKNTMGKGYSYFTETDLYNALKPKMEKAGISYTIQKKGNVILEPKGNMWLYASDGVLTLAKGDDTIELEIFLTAMNTDPAKALGSALTYGARYWLCKVFGIATDELDPDNDTNSKEVAKSKVAKPVQETNATDYLINMVLTNKEVANILKPIIEKDMDGKPMTKSNITEMIKIKNKTQEYTNILKESENK